MDIITPLNEPTIYMAFIKSTIPKKARRNGGSTTRQSAINLLLGSVSDLNFSFSTTFVRKLPPID